MVQGQQSSSLILPKREALFYHFNKNEIKNIHFSTRATSKLKTAVHLNAIHTKSFAGGILGPFNQKPLSFILCLFTHLIWNALLTDGRPLHVGWYLQQQEVLYKFHQLLNWQLNIKVCLNVFPHAAASIQPALMVNTQFRHWQEDQILFKAFRYSYCNYQEMEGNIKYW